MKSVGDNRDDWEAERLVAIQTMTAVVKKALLSFIRMLASWLHTHTHKDTHTHTIQERRKHRPQWSWSWTGFQFEDSKPLKQAAKIIYSCLCASVWPSPATWAQQVTPQPNKPSYQKLCNVNKLYLNPLKCTHTHTHTYTHTHTPPLMHS